MFSHVVHIALIDMVIECDLDATISEIFANNIIGPEESLWTLLNKKNFKKFIKPGLSVSSKWA